MNIFLCIFINKSCMCTSVHVRGKSNGQEKQRGRKGINKSKFVYKIN